MSLAAGTRLGPYEILAPIGAGGMGEVYRARDTRLGRDVAIKVLPGQVASDPEALARFEREARAVAALNHPHILSLFDVGRQDGTTYAVTELLEGATLRDQLKAGALPVRKAVEYAIQIAQALAAAHAKGIIHRDLKPDNVFVTRDGGVKLLDFGLAAQSGGRAPEDADDTTSPTRSRYTDPGTILGTAGYMAPEQVRGQAADHRADVFAFGCTLFEMLTGVRAFKRDTAAETMTAILKDDPAWPAGKDADVPPALARLVGHCLEKSPEERFQSARDLAFGLQNAFDASGARAGTAVPAPRSRAGRRVATLAWLAVGGIIGGLADFGLARRLSSPEFIEPVRMRPLTFSGQDGEPSASPDGRLIAFSSGRDGVSRIWIKQLHGGGEAPLTRGPDRRPRFSPDGSSVMFLRVEGRTQSAYRVALVGGEPRKVAGDLDDADWSPDGRRLAFTRLRGAAEGMATLGVVDLGDGTESILFEVRQLDLTQPRWSPDGQSIAVIEGDTVGTSGQHALLLVDVATRKARMVTPRGDALGCLAWSGEGKSIVLARAGSRVGDYSGAPGRVFLVDPASGRERSLFWTTGLFPLSGSDKSFSFCDLLDGGRLVFDATQASVNLLEVDVRPGGSGAVRALTEGSSRDRQPAYSRDGERIVFSSNRGGNMDLWLLDRRTAGLRQLTDDPAQDWDPGFTPDGRHVLWSSDRSGHYEIWIADAEGSDARLVTHDGVDAQNPTATPDGSWIVYVSFNPEQPGIYKIHPDGSGATVLVPGIYYAPEISPDGRYAAYVDFHKANVRNTIRFVEIATGQRVPFEVPVSYPLSTPPDVIMGRMRWTSDGRSLVFIGTDSSGLSGVLSQDFTPGRDIPSPQRRLAGFSRDFVTESLGLSPDGRHLTITALRRFSSLWIAEGVPGVQAPRSGRLMPRTDPRKD